MRGLRKAFAGAPLYDGFDVVLPHARITSVFGPNGCGKSTLINIMAGLVPADAGEVLFGGRTLREVVIGYVFQDYRGALMPWMSAERNVTYPLRRRGMARRDVRARLDELVARFDVRFDLRRYPYQLSGGQQQMVSMMRALAPRPEVMFLDEPFSALDYEARLAIRDILQRVQVTEGTTMVLVSHDLEDAVFLADRILLLTRRPTRIAGALDFALAKPRGPETLSDPEFVATQARALALFRAALD